MAVLWQLRGLHGCYGVYIPIFFVKVALRCSCRMAVCEGLTVALMMMMMMMQILLTGTCTCDDGGSDDNVEC